MSWRRFIFPFFEILKQFGDNVFHFLSSMNCRANPIIANPRFQIYVPAELCARRPVDWSPDHRGLFARKPDDPEKKYERREVQGCFCGHALD